MGTFTSTQWYESGIGDEYVVLLKHKWQVQVTRMHY
jgi:hypothetical protein